MTSMTTSTARMRIAMVATELGVGGAERCLAALSLGLDRARFETHVFSLAGRPAAERAALVTALEAAGINMEFLGLDSSRSFRRGLRLLANCFQQLQPDLVQTYLFHANVLGSLAARRANVPRLVTGIRVTHENWFRRRLERRCTQHADAHVCVSRDVAQYAANKIGLPESRLHVIPNGIDVSRFDDVAPYDLSPFGVDAATPVIGCIARLQRQKGVDRLLDTAPRLLEQLRDWKIVIAGDGPQRRQLEARVKRLRLEARVHFLGWQARTEALLKRIDVLAIPSRWEGMSNVLLEAMAARVPLVATDTEGTREVLGASSCDCLASRQDLDDFVGQLIALCRDPARRRRVVEQNWQRVDQHFPLTAMIENHEKLYTSLRDR